MKRVTRFGQVPERSTPRKGFRLFTGRERPHNYFSSSSLSIIDISPCPLLSLVIIFHPVALATFLYQPFFSFLFYYPRQIPLWSATRSETDSVASQQAGTNNYFHSAASALTCLFLNICTGIYSPSTIIFRPCSDISRGAVVRISLLKPAPSQSHDSFVCSSHKSSPALSPPPSIVSAFVSIFIHHRFFPTDPASWTCP